MACIKGVNRSALAAFSLEGIYMAAGTMAGAVDLSFSSSANLEIFKLDFQSDNQDLPVVGTSTSSERFNRLSWGRNPSSGSEEFSMGLIAGGLVDGNIGLWNPHALICSEPSENVLVTQLSRHRGPVRGLEFNALVPNHLASGADEGEICVWDIAKPAEPTHFPPLKGSGSATQGEISYLSWNSKVQHILASTSYNGTTVVWDLKRQKPALSIPDPYRRRCSVLQWHPDLATQLIVASDDDSSPSLRLWDMRNTMLPVREFVGHTKGVIAMSWCQSYSSYLLTCGKDNRTICWDTVSGEIVTELPAGTNWNFDIHWYPKIPGVISASSFDGKIGIYNIEGCSRFGTGEGNFGAALLRAPKWYKRKAGVSFGFGGKLVSFCSKDAPAGASEVYVHNLVAERSLVGRSSEFEAAVHDRDRSSLRLLCDRKSLESRSEDDRETWGFLKVMFEDDGTARTKLLTHFGFSLPFETKDTTEDNLSQEVSAIGLEDKVTDKEEYVADKPPAYDNGEDFFNNLRSPKAEMAVSDTGDSFNVGGSVLIVEEMQQEMDGQEDSDDPSFDDAIQCALVVGDYKVAVAHCISANKMADALVIAHVGGGSLWKSTRDKYLKMSHSPYLKVVSAMFNNDLSSLVNTRPLKSWKETLALFCTFAQGEEWSSLCDLLASRLMTVGYTRPATLCYICSGNIDKTVEIWSRSLTIEYAGRSYVDHLQDLMEKTVVLALATGQKQFSASLWKLIEKYAEILASQGLLTTAMEYLKLMGIEELSPELTILQDRIAQSIESEKEVSKSSALENYRSEPGTLYGADQPSFATAESSGHYYQEASPSQEQQSVSGSPYGGNYQHSFGSSYVQGHGAPAPYQPAPQPQIFLPSQSPQVPQMNFAPSPVTTRPPVKPFIPATPAALRNVGQYQPPTLGSQLYPETGYGSLGPIPSQAGPSLAHKMPRVLAPNPASMGYIPSMNLRTQRPGMGPMQSSSPTQPSQLQPAVTPTTLPPTVQTVDTSSVAVRQRPVITTLTRLFNETSEALGGSRANPARKREIEDNSKKIGALLAKLNSGDISKNAAEKLVQLCLALDNGDFTTALQIQVQLTTSDWDECNFWLANLKRMIKTRQNVR